MDLSEFYPVPADLIRSEVCILNHLRNDKYIKECHWQLAHDASNCYGRYKTERSSLEFVSYLDVNEARRDGDQLRLVIAAAISSTTDMYNDVTYCFSVCRKKTDADTFEVLRKFHFDVAVEGEDARKQPHPRFHLQYCGKMLPRMREFGCNEQQFEQMHPWLSEPRLLFWPTSLGLLVDMALREFSGNDSINFRRDPEWKALVRGQEDLLLKRFLQKCVDAIVDNKGRKRTLADEFYVS